MSDVPSDTIDRLAMPEEPCDGPERPTRVRYGVLAFLAAMTFVLYLDRVCIGQSATAIKRDLGISDAGMTWVINAFVISYSLFEIPTGRWGDRFGSRGVLARIVVWWSFFTALTGAAAGLTMLLIVRFLFGAGEAGALPNSARVLREWFPESSRGRAQGIITTAMMIGGTVAPLAAQKLINAFGWRWTFVIFGLGGLAWAVSFYLWFRDDPAEHTGTNRAERSLISSDGDSTRKSAGSDLQSHGPIPWAHVFRNKNVWLLGGAMITMSGVYMLMTYWYPTYLQEGRGVSPDLSSWLSGMVLGAGAVGCFFGGWLTDFLVRKTGGPRWSRTAQSVVGAGLAALGLLASVFAGNTVVSSILVALACFGVQLQVPAWWASATQVSGKHVGALFGLMNMIGNVGGAILQTVFGYFVEMMKSWGYTGRARWDPGIFVFVAVALLGMAMWSQIDPEKVVENEASEPVGPNLASSS
jgi:ACS family glucarate transporter-like MFS transporter